jgi:DNA-binding transcriptional LysR family regulator
MRPDLISLALFVRITELKSITKAAGASHMALAAASRRITQLEEQYGVQLLLRTAKGVELTPAGSAMLSHAREMLAQADAMRAEISDYSKGVKGMVRITANASALAQYLPDDLASFSAKHPSIKLSLEEERSGAIVDAVHAGSTDIGIVMEGPSAEGLEMLAYRTDQLGVAVPKKHPVKAKKVEFAELLDYDFVGLESNTVISQILLQQATHAGKPLRLRVQVKSFDVVARMVQAGLGIGVLPEAAIHAFAESMGLRLVSLSDPWATRKMFVCVRARDSLAAPARQLTDHLVAAGRS